MKKCTLAFVILAFCGAANAATPAESAPAPIALVAIKPGSQPYISICSAFKDTCKGSAAIWKAKNSDDSFYLILPGTRLMEVQREGDTLTKVAMWDFSGYKTEHTPDEDLTQDENYIYPALYPLSKTKWAVAIVSRWSAGYSGGGRSEEIADFMMLNRDGSYQPAFKNVPFSSAAMIRACFTEADYAKSAHCHDESWSVLRLKITDTAKAFYSWRFITTSYSWPAFKDKKATEKKTIVRVEYPFQQALHAPDKASASTQEN